MDVTATVTPPASVPAPAAAVTPAPAWQDGPPACILDETFAIDRRICRHLVCLCGRQGMRFRPQHRGPKYRVLAECPGCGRVEQV